MAASVPRILRKVHYWASLFLIITILVVSVSGLLLVMKKDVAALQPPIAAASRAGVSNTSIGMLIAAVRNSEGRGALDWHAIDRIDVRPADGIAKVILADRYEYQVDLHDGRVLQVGYRTSDLIETIHNFSIMGSYGKYLIALPSGIALLVMWATGTYLFLAPFLARRRKRRSAPA